MRITYPYRLNSCIFVLVFDIGPLSRFSLLLKSYTILSSILPLLVMQSWHKSVCSLHIHLNLLNLNAHVDWTGTLLQKSKAVLLSLNMSQQSLLFSTIIYNEIWKNWVE